MNAANIRTMVASSMKFTLIGVGYSMLVLCRSLSLKAQAMDGYTPFKIFRDEEIFMLTSIDFCKFFSSSR